jgi:hypothetical protein
MNIIKTLNKKLFLKTNPNNLENKLTNYSEQKLFLQNHALSQETYQILNRDNIEIIDNNIVISTKNVYKYTQQITENCILDFVNKVNSRKKVNAKIIIKKDYNVSKINYSIYGEQFKNKNLFFCVDQEELPLYFMIGNCFFVHNKNVNENVIKNLAILNKQNFMNILNFECVDFDIIYE